jgi:serine/threonine-protein kinase
MPAMSGMRFGKYELISRLGVGGMGEVWRARDHDLHREVAIKFLPERYAADTTRLGRFAQEARAASQLNHPNIVTIHEVGQTSGLPYIVMELVLGETLREIVPAQQGRGLGLRRLLDIGAQLADGLAKAHSAGIVHRDLKPENVMVTSDGFVKVLDFGLAKLRADGDGEQEPWCDTDAPTRPEAPLLQTAVGAVMGTAGYMSPEQARGRPVDYRSDQFTLGAILYEMATGRQAFHRETLAQTIAAIIEDAPEPLSVLSPGLPPPVRWIIERCLAKDPAERYASTLDLARELRGLGERLGEVTLSWPSPAPGPGRPRPGRRIALRALVAIVAAGTLTWMGPPAVEWATLRLGMRPVPREKHVAVLPFRTSGETPEDRALAEGLAELLTVRLAQLERFQPSLWLEPSVNVLQAGVTSATHAERALGVTLIVSGSVSRLEGRLVLTATLEDARRRRTLRAVTAESVDALVGGVVQMLELELHAPEAAALRAASSGVTEAATLATLGFGYTPYTEGRSALERYEQVPNIERAIELFARALEQDPRYALAHAGLAEAYWRLYRTTRKPEHVALARRHCERALALDDLSAVPWITLGIIEAGTGHAEEAVVKLQRALDRNPRSAEAHRELGDAYERLRRDEDAEAAYARAMELRPGSWANHNYRGAFLAARGRYEDAAKAFDQALALAPDNARVWSNLAAVRLRQERTAEAEAALRESLRLLTTSSALGNLGALQFSQGRWAEAARTLERATALAPLDYRPWHGLGGAYHWAPGERPRAAAAFRRAAELAADEHRLDPQNRRVLIHLADCKAMLGQNAEARALAQEALAGSGVSAPVARIGAGVYEQLGERETALRWLEAALRGGHPRGEIDRDPWLVALRDDPRYGRLTAVIPGG